MNNKNIDGIINLEAELEFTKKQTRDKEAELESFRQAKNKQIKDL